MFGRKKGPKAGHTAVVLLADPRDGSFERYYMATCNQCDWLGDAQTEEEPAFQEARKHAEHVDPEVRDTLHPDYKPH